MLTVGVGGHGLTKKESSDETTHSWVQTKSQSSTSPVCQVNVYNIAQARLNHIAYILVVVVAHIPLSSRGNLVLAMPYKFNNRLLGLSSSARTLSDNEARARRESQMTHENYVMKVAGRKSNKKKNLFWKVHCSRTREKRHSLESSKWRVLVIVWGRGNDERGVSRKIREERVRSLRRAAVNCENVSISHFSPPPHPTVVSSPTISRSLCSPSSERYYKF